MSARWEATVAERRPPVLACGHRALTPLLVGLLVLLVAALALGIG